MRNHIIMTLFLPAALLSLPVAALSQAQQEAKVDAIFARYNRSDSPGCALGVIRDGRMIYARGYGIANLEHGIPIGARTIFDLGSTSKQFTAACIVLLAQEGKLSYDDDIRKFVPEMPDYGSRITVRHLLHHASGLRDYLALMSLAGVDFDGITTEEDALRLIARQRELNFKPGDEHLYSNSGYFLLSIIVQRASGKSLSQYAQERIFGPLVMKDTHLHNDHTRIVQNRATGYAPNRSGGFQIDMSGFEQTGDGAVMTSVEDLLLWDENFYQPRVGGEALIAQLHSTGMLNDGEKLRYAFGLTVSEYRGLKTVNHGGSWAGYRAELLRFPEQKFSVACLCNLASADPSRLARQVSEVYLADHMKPQAAADEPGKEVRQVSISAQEAAKYVGLYRNPVSGDLRRVSFADGRLRMDAFGAPLELAPLEPGTFRVGGPASETTAIFDRAGSAGGVRLQLKRQAGKPEIYAAVRPAAPSEPELGAYEGVFFSPELEVQYSVVLEGGKLFLRGRNLPKDALQPTFGDGFALAGRFLEFRRDASGRVSGFLVQAGRIRNVRFERRVKSVAELSPTDVPVCEIGPTCQRPIPLSGP